MWWRGRARRRARATAARATEWIAFEIDDKPKRRDLLQHVKWDEVRVVEHRAGEPAEDSLARVRASVREGLIVLYVLPMTSAPMEGIDFDGCNAVGIMIFGVPIKPWCDEHEGEELRHARARGMLTNAYDRRIRSACGVMTLRRRE